jgi:membrane protein
MADSGRARRMAAGLGRVRRLGAVEHLGRAFTRYQDAHAGRLAAAVTYYAFFAAFSLGLLGFAILGYVLDDPKVLESVQTYLAQNLPRLDAQALRDARGTAGLIAFVVLTVAGVLWVDALRSSIRSIWQLNEYPGRFFMRPLIDLVVLAGLGLLLAASLAVSFGAEALLHWLLPTMQGRWLLTVATFLLGIGVNTVLSVAVLTGLPRLRMPLRRVLLPALLIVAGLEVIKTVGRIYLGLAAANPAYQVVTGAVGLLLFLNLLNQVILFAAALTATGTVGTVTDLAKAEDPPPQREVPVVPRAQRPPHPRVPAPTTDPLPTPRTEP